MTSLAAYMKQSGWSDAEMARRIGVSRPFVTHLRHGRKRPSAKVAKQIEDATAGQVRAASLLGVEAATEPPAAVERSEGRWSVTLDEQGCVTLPSRMMASLGFGPGEQLVFHPEEGEGVLVTSVQKTIAEVQALLHRNRPGVSLVDELIAERRAEAPRE